MAEVGLEIVKYDTRIQALDAVVGELVESGMEFHAIYIGEGTIRSHNGRVASLAMSGRLANAGDVPPNSIVWVPLDANSCIDSRPEKCFLVMNDAPDGHVTLSGVSVENFGFEMLVGEFTKLCVAQRFATFSESSRFPIHSSN